VLGVLFLGEVSPAFLPSKKACGTDQLRHFWVRQQYLMSQDSPLRMKIAPLFSGESPMSLALTTTHENGAALGHDGASTSLHSRRGYAGASCPQERLTRASLQHHHLSPAPGEHAEETCPWSGCAAARALRARSHVLTEGEPVCKCCIRSVLGWMSIRRTSK